MSQNGNYGPVTVRITFGNSKGGGGGTVIVPPKPPEPPTPTGNFTWYTANFTWY